MSRDAHIVSRAACDSLEAVSVISRVGNFRIPVRMERKSKTDEEIRRRAKKAEQGRYDLS